VTEAVHELKQVIDVLRDIAERSNPRSTIPFSLFDLVETQDGFGLSRGTGAVLLYANVADAPPSAWSLQCTAAIAFDTPYSPNIAMWVNQQNRQSNLGKYYYAVTPDQSMAAIMWEMHVWSRLLRDLGGMQGQAVIHWLVEIINQALEKASDEAVGFVQHFGGRVLAPNEEDLIALYVASDG
jgi:hypothetical protein